MRQVACSNMSGVKGRKTQMSSQQLQKQLLPHPRPRGAKGLLLLHVYLLTTSLTRSCEGLPLPERGFPGRHRTQPNRAMKLLPKDYSGKD